MRGAPARLVSLFSLPRLSRDGSLHTIYAFFHHVKERVFGKSWRSRLQKCLQQAILRPLHTPSILAVRKQAGI
jgi:hypothetical protein